VDIPVDYFLVSGIGLTVFQVIFISIGLLCGIILSDTAATGVGIALNVMLFFTDIISKIKDSVEFIKYYTPVYYLDLSHIVKNASLKTPEIYVLIFVSLAIFAVGAFSFNRKNIDV